MSETILSDYQSTLREAHRQAQVVEQMYRDSAHVAKARLGADVVSQRLAELEQFIGLLDALLNRAGLLPAAADPERVGFKELLGEISQAVTSDVDGFLRNEELELEQLGERLLNSREPAPPRLADAVEATRAARNRLTPD